MLDYLKLAQLVNLRFSETLGSLRMYTTAAGGRLNKIFEINDCMKMLSCIYFLMNLIQFRTSKTEL